MPARTPADKWPVIAARRLKACYVGGAKLHMKTIAVLTISGLVLATRALASDTCSPKQMVKVVIEDQSPSLPKGDFAALPKTIYRYQSGFGRIEEANDVANNIHGLIVINEPDSWMVDLSTREGIHAVDQKEPFVVRMPVFAGYAQQSSFPRELLGLEFGCEAAFFDRWKSPEELLQGDAGGRMKRAFGKDGWLAVVVYSKKSTSPDTLFLFKGKDIVNVIHYNSYETGAPQLHLFEKPGGISFREARPN